MMQPVRDVLGRDPAGRAVLHQPDIVQVRHLGTADPLVDPADDIAKDALGVVLHLAHHLRAVPGLEACERDVEDPVHMRPAAPLRQSRLHREDIDLVVVKGMQTSRRWVRAPRPYSPPRGDGRSFRPASPP